MLADIMSNQTGKLFAEITGILEDMHGLAVEGQGHNLTTCEIVALRASLLSLSGRLGAKIESVSEDE